jgi:hypothetical protein
MALKAIYYPYSMSLSAATLRKAALLFDSLYFLDSEPWFIRAALARDKLAGSTEVQSSSQIEEDYALLMREGLIRTLDATSIAQDYDELLTTNVINDVTDDEFCKVCMAYSAETWGILRERIPGSLLRELYPGVGTFSEAISLQAIINSNGNIDLIGTDWVRRFAEFRWGGSSPISRERALEIFLEARGYRYVIGGDGGHTELPAYRFPFLQASSLRINECLVAAALNGFIPYTDSSIHDNLLRLKVNRALVALEASPDLRRQLSIELPVRLPQQSVALQILKYLIPDEALDRVPITEILRYRSKNVKLLGRFHSYLEVLSSEIEDVSAGDEYEKKIRRIVSSKVLPEIERARDNLISSYEESFGGLVSASAVTLTSTIGATIFGGLDLSHILLAGALAEGGVLAVKAPGELIGAWKGRRKNQRSPLAYVTGFDKVGT